MYALGQVDYVSNKLFHQQLRLYGQVAMGFRLPLVCPSRRVRTSSATFMVSEFFAKIFLFFFREFEKAPRPDILETCCTRAGATFAITKIEKATTLFTFNISCDGRRGRKFQISFLSMLRINGGCIRIRLLSCLFLWWRWNIFDKKVPKPSSCLTIGCW